MRVTCKRQRLMIDWETLISELDKINCSELPTSDLVRFFESHDYEIRSGDHMGMLDPHGTIYARQINHLIFELVTP